MNINPNPVLELVTESLTRFAREHECKHFLAHRARTWRVGMNINKYGHGILVSAENGAMYKNIPAKSENTPRTADYGRRTA